MGCGSSSNGGGIGRQVVMKSMSSLTEGWPTSPGPAAGPGLINQLPPNLHTYQILSYLFPNRVSCQSTDLSKSAWGLIEGVVNWCSLRGVVLELIV